MHTYVLIITSLQSALAAAMITPFTIALAFPVAITESTL